MTCGLVHASYSLPEWQAVKLTFFAPCIQDHTLPNDHIPLTYENILKKYNDVLKKNTRRDEQVALPRT